MAAQYRWDGFLLDVDAYRLERAGAPLALEPKALDLLVLMVRRPGHLFTKQEILDTVWNGTAVTDHALTRVVAQLRRVLGDEARAARYIETVPTRGYRWIHPVEAASAPAATSPRDSPAPVPHRGARRGAAIAIAGAVLVLLGFWLASRWHGPAGPAPAGASAAADPDTWVPGARPGMAWPVQVTTHDGLELHPALSPLGDAVAYVSDRTGAFEIHVRSFGGSGVVSPLTSDGGQNVQPQWSPDGRHIAYHSSARGGIWVIPSRGGIPRQVAPEGSRPAWSPDGRRIAFQSDEHADATPAAFGAQSGSTIWSVDADGTTRRELTRAGRPSGGHAAPAWSGDGRYLAFTVFDGGTNNGVWLLDAETLETTHLQAGAGLYEAVFAADTSALYVAGGEAMIVRLPFDAAAGRLRGAPEIIPVAGVPGVRGLSMSADGRQVAFAGVALSSQIWSQRLSAGGAPEGAPVPLTRDTSRRNSLPAISPDGRRVAYLSRRGGEPPRIWVMDADGGRAFQATSDDRPDGIPVWFADGRRIGYVAATRDGAGVWSVDVGARREELYLDLAEVHTASSGTRKTGFPGEVALAGSMLRAAFSVPAPSSGNRVLHVTDLRPFAPRALTDGGDSVGYPAWSPDERRLAVEIKDGSSTHAGVIDLGTGALRRLTSERGQTWVRSWSPDGGRIAVSAFRAGAWSLGWIDAATGAAGSIVPAAPPHVYLRYPAWSPQGGQVVFERGELRGNIWTLALR